MTQLFLRSLYGEKVWCRAGEGLENTFFCSHSIISASLLFYPRVYKLQEPFVHPLLSVRRFYADPPDSWSAWLVPFHGEKWKSGRVSTFSNLATNLYFFTQWLKACISPSFWLVSISYYDTWQVSSLQLSLALEVIYLLCAFLFGKTGITIPFSS